MTDPKYAAFTALDPFFDIVQQGLAGLVDGDHYFDTIADDAEFEFRYHFPGWPRNFVVVTPCWHLYARLGTALTSLALRGRLRDSLPDLEHRLPIHAGAIDGYMLASFRN